MSVLNQSGEEQVECPLCMEPLEVDDLNFYPCTCGYQICRFCWHRIRTDENGLCPACRKAYSENPADFTPLSKEQVAQLKAEKRQRDQQRKAKLSESRKHLANVRVVQKNLVFVVGLPMRLADAEILKRHEYFGKFGKIHKVVINQSTSYAGSQGPSASAYVTYVKSDDALRAIQNVNNITIDGRQIKSSLGTTKYCSHFMKNQPCPKPDCMYLHDFGDPKASFTKEQMHAGKHQEYERKLHDMLISKTATQQQEGGKSSGGKGNGKEATQAQTANPKDSWPHLDKPEKTEKKEKERKKSKSKNECNNNNTTTGKKEKGKTTEHVKSQSESSASSSSTNGKERGATLQHHSTDNKTQSRDTAETATSEREKPPVTEPTSKMPILDDNSSFFSQNSFQKIAPDIDEQDANLLQEGTDSQAPILNDSLPNINSTEDWEAAFGFTKQNTLLEELAKQRSNVKDTLETFGNNGYSPLDMFGSLDGAYQNGYDSKLQESLLEALSSKHGHFGGSQSQQFSKADRLNGLNSQYSALNGLTNTNGLDQQMSKFFTDFYKNGVERPNGLHHVNGMQQPGGNGFLHGMADRQNIFLLQQRQIEEQLVNLNLKQQQTYGQMNGFAPSGFVNGDGPSYGPLYHGSLMKSGQQQQRSEDELDFDPFHETQKALAELMENEESHKVHGSGRGNVAAGLLQNSHLPPPPGFMQTNPHMNSFGSKILPYLNMGNSQQQINSATQQQSNWSGSYGQVQQQQQQHKTNSLGMCNDWKVLDPAIVSSSRHFLLANRDHYSNLPLQQPQQQRSTTTAAAAFDYQNFSTLQQPTLNGYSSPFSQHNQPNLNWLSNELNTQIASPPGFRAGSQATKQQEC